MVSRSAYTAQPEQAMRVRHPILVAAAVSLLASVVSAPTIARAAALAEPSATWAAQLSGAANSPDWGTQPYAGTAVGDLSGNGQEDVVAAFPNGDVYAFSAGGSLLPGWPQATGEAISGTPAIADLLGDGTDEVVVASQNGDVYAYMPNGSQLPGWPVYGGYGHSVSSGSFPTGFIGGAVVGDLFGNGQEEVVAAGLDHYLYAWNAQGQLLPGFPINLWDTAVNTPLLTDLTGNGQLDIVVGGDSVPGQSQTADLYAFPPTGCSSPNASLSGCDLPGWPETLHETPWSSPAAGDLLNNGTQEVVDGTGHDYYQTSGGSDTWGERVDAWLPGGQDLSGWPVTTSQPNFGSVALGDLTGSGQRDVVVQGEDGTLRAYGPTGQMLPGWPANEAVNDLGSPSIAPVNGSGNGVWAPAPSAVWGFNSTGSAVVELSLNEAAAQTGASSTGYYLAYGAPTIVQLGAGQGLSAVVDFSNSAFTQWFVAVYPLAGTSSLTANSWPTFHGNMERTGSQAPIGTVTGTSVGSSSSSTNFTVNMGTVVGSVPTAGYQLWVDQASTGWQLYTTTTSSSSVSFTGVAGDTYSFFAVADNLGATAEIPKYAEATVTISGSATHNPALPFATAYAADMSGRVEPFSSPDVVASNVYPNQNLIRGIALTNGGKGGYTVDAYGGIHPFGNAAWYNVAGGYYPGWDIIRGIAVLPNDSGGYTVDAYGGLHQFGNAPYLQVTGYYPGQDLIDGVVLLPGGGGGYTVDIYGGLHPFGDAPYMAVSAYYPGQNLIRGVALNGSGTGGFTVDAYGGIHPFGNEAWYNVAGGYYPGWDIIRGIAVLPNSTGGYTVDGYGGLHAFGSAPELDTPSYKPGQNLIVGIALAGAVT
jgi:hypothetical protein